MDFVAELFTIFVEDKECKLSKVGQDSYAKSLAPHHPWVLKKAVSLGMNALPYRATFI